MKSKDSKWYFCDYCCCETKKKPRVVIETDSSTLHFCNDYCMKKMIKVNDEKLK